jgi:hypothetical protein
LGQTRVRALSQFRLCPTLPAGYIVTVDDIIFVNKYRDLESVLSQAQYEFTEYGKIPDF